MNIEQGDIQKDINKDSLEALRQSLSDQVREIDQRALNKQESYKEKISAIMEKWSKEYDEGDKAGLYEAFGNTEENPQAYEEYGALYKKCVALMDQSLESLDSVKAEELIATVDEIDAFKNNHNWHDKELMYRLNQFRDMLSVTLEQL